MTYRKPLLVILIFTFFIAGYHPLLTQPDDNIDQQVTEIISQMSVEEKIGQLFMVYWSKQNDITPSLQELISQYKVGGILISGANIDNDAYPTAAEQVALLSNQLQTYAWEHNHKLSSEGEPFFLPLFLAADHEGDGPRLTRIRSGMTPIPSQLSIGATWSTENAEQIRAIGCVM